VTATFSDFVEFYRRRHWSTAGEPTSLGYSIGRWIDEAGGRYNVLEVDTRGPFKGPRANDASGLPLHFDNQSIFNERFHLDNRSEHSSRRNYRV
jgi:hypothetical protein